MAAMICEWGQDGVGQGGRSVIRGRSWVPEQDSRLDLSCFAIWHSDQISECRKDLESRLPQSIENTALNAEPVPCKEE